jgi:hypothetical protein
MEVDKGGKKEEGIVQLTKLPGSQSSKDWHLGVGRVAVCVS